MQPNRNFAERVATLPYLIYDHYESTHYECDILSDRGRSLNRCRNYAKIISIQGGRMSSEVAYFADALANSLSPRGEGQSASESPSKPLDPLQLRSDLAERTD